MNSEITQAAIAEFNTSQPGGNIISAHIQIPRMGRQRGVNSFAANNGVSVTGSGSSKRFSIQYDNYGSISIMVISKITNRNHHVSSNNSTKHDGEIGYNSTIDIISHADTHCFGKKFLIVSST